MNNKLRGDWTEPSPSGGDSEELRAHLAAPYLYLLSFLPYH